MKKDRSTLLREKLEQLEPVMSWRMKEEVMCCGITIAQRQVLTELSQTGEMCLAQLAQKLGLDASTLSRTTNRMVQAKLLNRVTNSSDRRYVSLVLTDKGKQVLEEMKGKCEDYYSKVFRLIPEEKQDQVIDSITLLLEAITAYKEQLNEKC